MNKGRLLRKLINACLFLYLDNKVGFGKQMRIGLHLASAAKMAPELSQKSAAGCALGFASWVRMAHVTERPYSLASLRHDNDFVIVFHATYMYVGLLSTLGEVKSQ